MSIKESSEQGSGAISNAKISFIFFLIGVGIVCLSFAANIIERILGYGNSVSGKINSFVGEVGCFFPFIVLFFSIMGLASFISLLRAGVTAKKPYIYALTSFLTGFVVIWIVAISSIVGLIKIHQEVDEDRSVTVEQTMEVQQ